MHSSPVVPADRKDEVQATAAADPTKIDSVVHGPFSKEFTSEQKSKLDAMSKEFGELQARIELADREADNIRANSVGLPGIREHVEALRAARAEMQAFVAGLPERKAAEARVRAAEPPSAAASDRYAKFSAHVMEHLKAASDPAAECEWCRRDATRIAARDSKLGRDYKVEAEALMGAADKAAEELRKARVELSRVVRTASGHSAASAVSARMQSAQKALDDAMAMLPDLVAVRSAAAEARERQSELRKAMTEIHKAARVVLPSVAQRPDAVNEEARIP